MKKRTYSFSFHLSIPGVFAYVFLLSIIFIALYAYLIGSMFIVKDDDLASQAFWLLLVGGILLYLGFEKIREVKAQGEHITWWKQPFIILSLAFVSLVPMREARLQLHVQFITLFLLPLLLTGIFIYAIHLLLSQQIRREKRPEQPHEDE
jgi:hypothetical protein